MPRTPKKPATPSPLSSAIEREIVPADAPSPVIERFDTVDNDLDGYAASFLKDCSNLSPMPKLNLLSQESAREAVKLLERHQQELEEKLRTAAVLKTLFNQRRQ